jgi:very-short-patch-repair endonuclease
VTLDPRQPFTRQEALAAGITESQLRGPSFRRVVPGVFVHANVADHPLIRAKAALLVHSPVAWVSHSTAARLRNLPIPKDPDEHVSVPLPKLRTRRAGLHCHLARSRVDVELVSGIRASSAPRNFVELAGMLGLVDLVVVGDAMVRKGFVTPGDLVAYCQSSADRHVLKARIAAAFVRERVDSPMETRLRMLLVLAGLPEPKINLKVYDDQGVVLMRLDLSYPSVKLAIEYDGRQHAERRKQWLRDLDRREELDIGEWRLLVVTSKGVYSEPERTIERVWNALRSRGWKYLEPPRDEWRRHFRA